MYNRYIPNPDGSFARKPYSRPQNPDPGRQKPSEEKPKSEPRRGPAKKEHPQNPSPCQSPAHQQPVQQPALGFLRSLLPKEFDTGDLLVVLLLLLIAADCEKEKPDALLTLALYFFM